MDGGPLAVYYKGPIFEDPGMYADYRQCSTFYLTTCPTRHTGKM